MGKIQFNHLNYHIFSRWLPKLSKLALWPPNYQNFLKMSILEKYPHNTFAMSHFLIKKKFKVKKIKN